MEAIINFFTGTLNTVAWLYIFLPCTIVGGLYLTIRNRGIQFTRFGYAMKNTVGKMFQKQEAGAGAVTPLQAVTTALAATVGTGNIVGTSQAIALGGYGAVFWLWLAALLGMIIKYSEVTLSIKYRERDAKGDWSAARCITLKTASASTGSGSACCSACSRPSPPSASATCRRSTPSLVHSTTQSTPLSLPLKVSATC